MTLSLAYKYIGMMVMLAEVNFFCGKTGLSPGYSFTQSDVRKGSHVGPPKTNDFSGSILTDQYFFGFGWGHLANFYKRGFMPQKPDSAIRERNLELAKFPSVIDANGAHHLATNWLAALGVDVPMMEAKYRRNIIQWRYYPEGKDGLEMMLPVYNVEWRGFILRSRPTSERTVVSVTVFGATKELVEYHVFDEKLFLRPSIQIKNPKKLLAIPDAEFVRYTVLQKSNLVVESVGALYPGYSLPEVIRTKQTNSSTRSVDPTTSETKAPAKLNRRKLHTVPPSRGGNDKLP